MPEEPQNPDSKRKPLVSHNVQLILTCGFFVGLIAGVVIMIYYYRQLPPDPALPQRQDMQRYSPGVQGRELAGGDRNHDDSPQSDFHP